MRHFFIVSYILRFAAFGKIASSVDILNGLIHITLLDTDQRIPVILRS